MFLDHLARNWGKLPLAFLNQWDPRSRRYGFIGLAEPHHVPSVATRFPGGHRPDAPQNRLFGLDQRVRQAHLFLEHREAYLCGWCALAGGKLVLEPHPASQQRPAIFEYSAEIDVIGQVTGVAMSLASGTRCARPCAAPSESPNP